LIIFEDFQEMMKLVGSWLLSLHLVKG